LVILIKDGRVAMRYLFILFMGLFLFVSCNNSPSSTGGSETWMLTGATLYDTPDCSGEGTTGMCAALDQNDTEAMITCFFLGAFGGSESDCNEVETCSFMTYYELLGNQVYTISLDGNGGAILNTSGGCTDGLSTSESSCNNNGGGWVNSNTVNGTYTESSSSDGRTITITNPDDEFDVQLFINGSTATVYIPNDDDDDGIADSCMEGILTEQ